jgi:CheY-like chemotaxis protein
MKALEQRASSRGVPLWREPHDAPTFLAGQRGPTVLVVEDDPVQALLLELMLKHLGVSHRVVSDGAHAIDAVKTASYALVLMDYQMPGTNGIDATLGIRRWEHEAGKPPTPIVAVTASAMPTECERYIEAGMNGVVTKPFSAKALAALLAQHHPAWPGEPAPVFTPSGVPS